MKFHSEWPRVKWATPHRKHVNHYSRNRNVVVLTKEEEEEEKRKVALITT